MLNIIHKLKYYTTPRKDSILYEMVRKDNILNIKVMYRTVCIVCNHLIMYLKYFWKNTPETSNHGYLFRGTDVGGNWMVEYCSGRNIFNSIYFYAFLL